MSLTHVPLKEMWTPRVQASMSTCSSGHRGESQHNKARPTVGLLGSWRQLCAPESPAGAKRVTPVGRGEHNWQESGPGGMMGPEGGASPPASSQRKQAGQGSSVLPSCHLSQDDMMAGECSGVSCWYSSV